MIKLELGGGDNPIKNGYLNLDIKSIPTVDLVCDFNKDALPYIDDSVDAIFSGHCLEHLIEHRDLLNEICRVCKVGADVEIRLPHWLGPCAYTVTHTCIISDHEVGFWSIQPKKYFKGKKKLVENVAKRHYQHEIYIDEVQEKFPDIDREWLIKRFPGCCHEVHYHFKVELND